jgi:hypothetical protein
MRPTLHDQLKSAFPSIGDWCKNATISALDVYESAQKLGISTEQATKALNDFAKQADKISGLIIEASEQNHSIMVAQPIVDYLKGKVNALFAAGKIKVKPAVIAPKALPQNFTSKGYVVHDEMGEMPDDSATADFFKKILSRKRGSNE